MGLTFAGGTDTTPGWGDHWLITFAGTWVRNETWSITITSTIGDATLGKGRVSRIFTDGPPTCCGVMHNRVYVGFPSFFAFSETGDATGWDVQAPGSGTVPWLSYRGQQDSVQAFASFQGRLAIFGSLSIQFWSVDADPNNFANVQTLENVGTIAPLSVQSIGDLDVYFLDSPGIRSLRARETTLNAFSTGVGIPVDQSVRADIAEGDYATACSIVEPINKQYWLFLHDKIYVLSNFPESKVQAWSSFLPTYGAGQTAFTPKKFVVYNNRVYCRGTVAGADRLLVYGGTNGTTYDGCPATMRLPWLDDKTPSTMKSAMGIDAAFQGEWTFKVGMDPYSGVLDTVLIDGSPTTPDSTKDSSFDKGRIPYNAIGTHYRFEATTSAAKRCILSSLTFKYQKGENV